MRRGPNPENRLPWAAVASRIEGLVGQQVTCARWSHVQGDRSYWTYRRGISEFARQSGIPRERLSDWKRRGITIAGADRIADALGVHPSELWGDAYYQIGNTCRRGHEWAVHGGELRNGKRYCRACARIHEQDYQARKAAA